MAKDDSSKNVVVRPVKKTAISANGKPVTLTTKQFVGLKHYAETLDIDASAKAAGYRDKTVFLDSEIVLAEIEKINTAWLYENRMTARFTAGEHMRMMQKFEDHYDKVAGKNKGQMAGVLAKMSDTALKASGKIGSGNGDGTSTNVMVQLNIGGSGEDAPVKNIDGVSIEVVADGQ